MPEINIKNDLIISEVGTSHGGSLEYCCQLIDNLSKLDAYGLFYTKTLNFSPC